MKRSAGLVFLLALCALVGVVSAGEPPFARGPYSGAPTAESIVISWVAAPPLPAILEVAPIATDSQVEGAVQTIAVGASPEEAKGQVDVTVVGLEPSTTYVYRVIVQSGPEILTSPIGRFETAPLPGQTVTFAVLSDTQWQWEGVNRLAVIGDAVAFDSARSGGFDFVLHAGDLVETPNAYYWEPWFDAFEPMLLAAPFIPVLGNHEKNSVSYYNAFSHPAGAGQNDERWWTLRWGDVVVVGLDTSVNRADRIQEQQAYARAELAGPEKWKFVIFHHPIYSSDAYHGSGYGYETIFHPIFVDAGVDIVFNGHAHNYERIEKDGVVYLVLGGGGAVPRGLAPTRVDGSIVAVENHNFYARVSARSDEISVDIVSVAEATETTFEPTPGELLDSFSVPKAAIAATSPQEVSAAMLPETVQAAPQTAPERLEPAVEPTASEPAEAAAPVVAAVPEPVGSAPIVSESVKPVKPVVAFEPPPSTSGRADVGAAALVALIALVAALAWVFLRVGR